MVFITIEIRYIFEDDHDSTFDKLYTFCEENKIEIIQTNTGLRHDEYIYSTTGKEGEEFVEYRLKIKTKNKIVPTLKFLEKEAIERITPLDELI
uniref:hypothetical protein n=1 Tax=Fulvivirga sp. TaxID=1931237 RepID=UPI004049A411